MARVIRDGARVVPGALADAHEEAARILSDARAEAGALAEAARGDIERTAREDARAELAAAHLEVEHARSSQLAALADQVVELSLAVAERVIGERFERDPAHVRALVEDALQRVRRASDVRVRVHPDDVGALEHLEVELAADATLGRGDCVVETDLGEVDGRLSVRLDALRRVLLRGARR